MPRSTQRVVNKVATKGEVAKNALKKSDPDLGRYSDPPLLVLASLADGPKHGHAMIDDIEQMSGARLGPGTLYGAIARLEREKLIEPLPEEDRRHPYRITPAGSRLLRAKLTTLHQFARAGLRRLELLSLEAI